MSERAGAGREASDVLLALYDTAMPEVFRYLSARLPSRALAEDLTAETFLAAAGLVRDEARAELGLPWLIGVARHKLVDHWRAAEREGRRLAKLVTTAAIEGVEEPFDERLEAWRVREVLADLPPAQRSALVLRYLDDLPVADVASALGRSLHATEALLARARAGFRDAYRRARSAEDA